MSARLRRAPLATTLSTHRIRTQSVAQRIVASTGLAPPALVIEPGAGDGILTAELSARGLEVIAVERDRDSVESLRARFANDQLVTIHHGDILSFPLPGRRPYSVFGNPPFALTSPLLRRLLSAPAPPARIDLVLQREAAFRWAGFDRESLLSLQLKCDYRPELRMAIHRQSFVPRPDVDCVLVSFVRRACPVLGGVRYRQQFLGLAAEALLSSKRTARRALEGRVRPFALAAAASRAGIDLDVPPGDIAFEEWLRLFEALNAPRRASRA